MQIYYSNKKYFIQVEAPILLQRNSQFSNLYNERINNQGPKRASEKNQARFIEKYTEYQTAVKRTLTRIVVGSRMTALLPIVRRESLSLYDELCHEFELEEKTIWEKTELLTVEEANKVCENIVQWLTEKGFNFANAGKNKRSRKVTNHEFIECLPGGEEGMLIKCKSSLSENQIQLAKYIEENDQDILSNISDAIMADYKRMLPYYELLLATKSGEKSWFPSPEQITKPHDYFACNKINISRDHPMIGIEGEILWFPELKYGAIHERNITTVITMDSADARL